MKILIKGYYGYGNLGDDILMLVSYRLIKKIYPSASITIFSNNSENNQLFVNKPGYNRYVRNILNDDVEIVDWSHTGYFDLILHGGGGIYFDSSNDFSIWYLCLNSVIRRFPIPFITKFDSFVRKLSKRAQSIQTNKRLGVGIGIGKYSKNSRRLYRELVEIGSYTRLTVRDQASFIFLRNHRMPSGRIELNTDLAFTNLWNDHRWGQNAKINRVGIVVKDGLEDELVHSLLKLRFFLEERGVACTFYSFDANYDKYCQSLYGRHNFIQYSPHKLHEFLEHLRSEHLLYTSRAHGAILGGCMGVPSVIFDIDVKLREVSKMFLNSSICISSWEVDKMNDAFNRINQSYPRVIDGLKKDVSVNEGFASKIEELITNVH